MLFLMMTHARAKCMQLVDAILRCVLLRAAAEWLFACERWCWNVKHVLL